MVTPSTDEGRLRFTQGVVAVLVLGGFVFRLIWMNALVAALVALAFALGPQADIVGLAYDRWLTVRRRAPASEPPERVRLVLATSVGLLAAATIAGLARLGGLGWLVALVAAGAAALYATTGIVAAGAFQARRRRPRPRPRPR
jgi:hypothetical protein